ncbi:hypothetical protein RLOC_00001757 [Lonchura striata]|uniref:Uncharacterized protein n=1 Tax=Lonchura striata TaxID=40157 RepID=A0A218U7M2_9PASE|nr:hypothetical protein RLOC_00001757 [Lonchura striata domestica]
MSTPRQPQPRAGSGGSSSRPS